MPTTASRDRSVQLAGGAMVLGGIFALVGNAIHPNLPEEQGLDVVAFANLINSNQSLWFVSHLLLFALIPLLLWGMVGLCRFLAARGEHLWTLPSMIAFGFWAVLNAGTIILDGFVIADMTQRYDAASSEAAVVFEYLHLTTLNTLSFSLFLWACGILFLGLSLLRSRLFHPVLSWAGLLIGAVGVCGYIAGIFGRYWVLGSLFTGYAIVFTLWIIILGITLLLTRKTA